MPRSSFNVVEFDKTRNDDQIPSRCVMGGGTVDAYDTGAAGTGERVGGQTATGRGVPDGDCLIL
jgi:hypothetical protein